MNVGDIIEQYASSYVLVTEKGVDESGKPKVTAVDGQGESSTWTDRPGLRSPDRYWGQKSIGILVRLGGRPHYRISRRYCRAQSPWGNRKSPPITPWEAVITGREERSIRVDDFSRPTDSIADHGRIRVITLPALDRREGAPRHQVCSTTCANSR
jgi:hypothetical protein